MRYKFLGSYFLATILVFSLPVYSAAYITNITVNNGKTFQIGYVHAGETVYIDRTYEILAGYPTEFDGLDLIKTACDDKYDSSDNYLSFDVSVSVGSIKGISYFSNNSPVLLISLRSL